MRRSIAQARRTSAADGLPNLSPNLRQEWVVSRVIVRVTQEAFVFRPYHIPQFPIELLLFRHFSTFRFKAAQALSVPSSSDVDSSVSTSSSWFTSTTSGVFPCYQRHPFACYPLTQYLVWLGHKLRKSRDFLKLVERKSQFPTGTNQIQLPNTTAIFNIQLIQLSYTIYKKYRSYRKLLETYENVHVAGKVNGHGNVLTSRVMIGWILISDSLSQEHHRILILFQPNPGMRIRHLVSQKIWSCRKSRNLPFEKSSTWELTIWNDTYMEQMSGWKHEKTIFLSPACWRTTSSTVSKYRLRSKGW